MPATSERQRKATAGLLLHQCHRRKRSFLLSHDALNILLPNIPPFCLLVLTLVSWFLAPPLDLGLTSFSSWIKGVCARAQPHHDKIFPVHNLGFHSVINYPAAKQSFVPESSPSNPTEAEHTDACAGGPLAAEKCL